MSRYLVLARLLFLFIAIPLVELVLLLLLADVTNWVFALTLVLLTGVLGAVMAKQQGFAAFFRIRQDLAEGRMPGDAALDAVMVLIASGLLLTPGVFTDVLAITMLIPATRAFHKRWLVRWFKSQFVVQVRGAGGAASRPTQVIDSYVVEGTRKDASNPTSLPNDR